MMSLIKIKNVCEKNEQDEVSYLDYIVMSYR